MSKPIAFFLVAYSIATAAIVPGPEIGIVFEGCYTDPNHPAGYRVIKMHDQRYEDFRMGECVGSDTDTDEKPYRIPAESWRDDGGDKISIDFRPKGGPAWIIGTWSTEKRGIVWEDGNLWSTNDDGCPSFEKSQ